MNLRNSQLRWVIVSILIVIVDLFTKYLANNHLTYAKPLKILSFLNLTLLYNYGAAFSLFSNANTKWQIILLSSIAVIVAIVILFVLIRLKQDNNTNLQAFALSLILGGALGNFINRLYDGFVIDFLDFHYRNYHWPAFNIADSAVCIGSGILLIYFWIKKS